MAELTVVALSDFDKSFLHRIANALEKLAENQPISEFPGERSSILDYIGLNWQTGRPLSDIFEDIRKGKHLK